MQQKRHAASPSCDRSILQELKESNVKERQTSFKSNYDALFNSKAPKEKRSASGS